MAKRLTDKTVASLGPAGLAGDDGSARDQRQYRLILLPLKGGGREGVE